MFAFFASIGFITLLMETSQLAPMRVAITVAIMGGFSILYAASSLARKYWLIPVLGVLEGVFFGALKNYYGDAARLVDTGSPLGAQLAWLGIGAILAVVAGYILFLVFFSQQGARYFRAQNEIALAGEIHRALVPPVQKTFGGFEIYGGSVPSGAVGGDLVDVAGDRHSWTGYVADVSGHGVSAGLLMAMFKTAVRTRATEISPEQLLEEVHRTLYPMKPPNMFATAGFLQCRNDRELRLSLAGHPPLLQYSKSSGEVSEYPTLDLPLGVLPQQTFSAVSVICEPGDILLLLTDGMTEVFAKDGSEMGVEPIKAAIRKNAERPLTEIFDTLRQIALAAGPQDDDQTMLIVRRTE